MKGDKKELRIGFVGREPTKTVIYYCSFYLKIVTLQKQLKTIDVNYLYTGARDGILILQKYRVVQGSPFHSNHDTQAHFHSNHKSRFFFPDHFTKHVIASLLQSFCLRLLAPPFGSTFTSRPRGLRSPQNQSSLLTPSGVFIKYIMFLFFQK